MIATLRYILILLLITGGTNLMINFGHETNITHANIRRSEPFQTRGMVTQHLTNYMLSLYKNFNRMNSGGIDLEPASLPLPYGRQADIIRSLLPKSIDKVGRRWILVFDFSSIRQEEEPELAELRFELPSRHPVGAKVIVDIFHQQESICEDNGGSCKDFLYLGSGTAQSESLDGLVMIDNTEVVNKWIKMNETEKQVHSKQREKFPRSNRIRQHGSKANDQQVMISIFSNLSRKVKQSLTATLLHDALQSKYLTMPVQPESRYFMRHKRSHAIKDRLSDMKHIQAGLNNSTLCRRVDFFVDFSLVGWEKWIIHPVKYNAYRCEGICPSPVTESLRPNNHAYLQSMLHFFSSQKAPPVCCVPVKMSSLSMIYEEHGGIVQQNYEGMIVEECGCQ